MSKYIAQIEFNATSDSDAEDAVREAVNGLQDYIETDVTVKVTHVTDSYTLDADGNDTTDDDDE